MVELVDDITVVDFKRNLGTSLVTDKLRVEVLELVVIEVNLVLELLEDVGVALENISETL